MPHGIIRGVFSCPAMRGVFFVRAMPGNGAQSPHNQRAAAGIGYGGRNAQNPGTGRLCAIAGHVDKSHSYPQVIHKLSTGYPQPSTGYPQPSPD